MFLHIIWDEIVRISKEKHTPRYDHYPQYTQVIEIDDFDGKQEHIEKEWDDIFIVNTETWEKRKINIIW